MNVDESAQILVPAYLQQYQMTGDPTQINTWITAYAKTRNIVNYQPMLFPDMRQQVAMQQLMASMAQPGAGGSPPQGGQPQGPAQQPPGDAAMQMIAQSQGGGMPPQMAAAGGAY
jgi:Ser/Thr protein kinase RdoA (MazF antagonist)